MSARTTTGDVITVVGLGADGWDGLTGHARHEITSAEVLMGSARQLDLVPGGFTRVAWPSPLLPALPDLLAAHAGRRVCVLASGDPLFHGIGATLVRLLGADRVAVVPHPSSASLACARLGWALDRTEVVSLVGRPTSLLVPHLQPRRRLLLLGADPRAVAELAPDARITVLEQLGGPDERVHHDLDAADPLHVLAVECGPGGLSRAPGLPDDAFEHDGQITKREVRAVSLALLGPRVGELLWDVGAGAGSIAVEWCRTHPACRALAVEKHPERAARVTRNATALGVPTAVRVVEGASPDALDGLERPDAVFVGGGVTAPGVVERCWAALKPGGRLVANAVTIESEAVLARWHAELGGALTRLSVSRAAPVGGFTGWRPHMPVTVWAVTKENE
ncbi:bifunctional cobalt-precorrin-7 (C(5))-methyltransferase/cobalt-precorrin-6B (C(15))-methyltransferase [Actinosynnema mirum]|uniref:Precorrin-6y C5,15-methyltransferase (Decarboxylating), CbiE subunit n=1 Tax=Actinosynnema mirum (strain ATCC 29888 / DSM 43827 / JCM 3225 / NBRC 14064 / NCIMB 13271 / NRRL B-12336 / IMRU 3971 / 101) TaxID=446462 RepID=C6WCV9_ACTMD|nr:bifunctional cobalt-precorrin-7 (C(5))-methyltransferase/cobalt-precorrin-6B (C(15))-methyltransferase [Actinosynnema mirum]ACU35726.1 precorrin-6y C5,15-methyltransferase (decarboxylating), CbiE subunit [Actinosynnema mirum DSM 43827]AXX29151.1 Cobalt-precorrin-6y C5-methyltransferase [Actinosynnema pretiosum subsp. pretiosum]